MFFVFIYQLLWDHFALINSNNVLTQCHYIKEKDLGFFKLSANVHVVYSSLPNSRLLFVNKYKIYKPDFAHIKYCCFNSYFWLSVYHIVFIELAIAIIEALQCKKFFIWSSYMYYVWFINFYLCMILIVVVVCIIVFLFDILLEWISVSG